MKPEPVPSAIVSRLLKSAKELEEWADTHRTASLAEHEQGVLEILRRGMGRRAGTCPGAGSAIGSTPALGVSRVRYAASPASVASAVPDDSVWADSV